MKTLFLVVTFLSLPFPALSQPTCDEAIGRSLVRLADQSEPCVNALHTRPVAAIACNWAAMVYSIELEIFDRTEVRKLCKPQDYLAYKAYLIQMRDHYRLISEY